MACRCRYRFPDDTYTGYRIQIQASGRNTQVFHLRHDRHHHRTTSEEWQNSNEFQDLVANKVLKAYEVKAKDGTEYERYYQVNSDHLKAFQTRTVNGMNLSRRVWNLKEQYKQELEMGLSVGIEKGMSAAVLAKELKKYLKEPDKLFRRVRDKYGNLQLSKNAKAYHPGRGVYRSSYKNAMRLTRSETNMAYRTAEQTRWRQFDFVVGYEIKLSQSHPCHDVCDTLAGKYPKTFKWTGWHPMDLCYCVSILKTDDEFWSDSPESKNEVKDVPQGFKDWVKDNKERIKAAEKRGTQPYFIRDNEKVVEKILKPEEPKKTALEVAKERHAARTKEDIEKIKHKWNNHREYVELRNNADYYDVKFNYDNGGLMATHKGHNFDKNKGWYEKSAQNAGYLSGDKVILEKEIHNVHNQKNTEGRWNDLLFEIAGAENGTSNNIRNALKHCASKPDAQVAVVFSLKKLSPKDIINGIIRYDGLKNTSQWKRFEVIIFVLPDNKIKKYYPR